MTARGFKFATRNYDLRNLTENTTQSIRPVCSENEGSIT